VSAGVGFDLPGQVKPGDTKGGIRMAMKVYDGTNFKYKPTKVYDGVSWVEKQVMFYKDGTWQKPTIT
jgi:hypothetical protein